MTSEIKRTEKEICKEWSNAMWSKWKFPFPEELSEETKTRIDERERIFEWLFGQREKLYTELQMDGYEPYYVSKDGSWKSFFSRPKSIKKI